MQRSWTIKLAVVYLPILIGMAASFAQAASNSGITYHGRILKPDGDALEGSGVQFKLQIRTAGNENCLLFEEIQTLDMARSAGVFAITLNDGSGTRSDSTGLSLDRVFANRGTFSLSGNDCAVSAGSSTTWTPNFADGRRFQVFFKTADSTAWEPLPSQMINFAPMAIEAKQVGGFTAQNLLRVEGPSGPAAAPVLTPANATELVALVGGTSALYTKAGQLNGVAIPTSYNANESIRWNGTTWVTYTTLAAADVQTFAKTALPVCTSGDVLSSDGTTLGCVTVATATTPDATTSTKGIVAIDSAGGIAVSGGTISLATSGVAAGTYTKVSVDVTGRVITGATLVATDIPSLDATKITTGTFPSAQIPSLDASKITTGTFATPGRVSGDAITSGTIGGSTALVTTGPVSSSSLSSKSIYVWDSDNTNSVQIVAPATASLTGNYVLTLPTTDGSAGEVLQTDGSGNLAWVSASAGSVTNVGLSLPSIFSVTGGPVTSSGTFNATLASQAANTVFAAPDGSSGTPTFRSLAAGDVPSLDAAKIASGTFTASQIPSLDASKVTTGTFAQSLIPALGAAQIPALDASKITTGTITNTVRNTTSVGTRSVEVYNSDSSNKVTIQTPATGTLTTDYVLTLPSDDGSNGQLLATDGSGNLAWVAAGGAGTVTNVGLSLPNIFSVAGGPVTTNGTFTATLASQAQNTFWAAPNGSSGAPTFRAMVAADVPALDAAQITTGTFASSLIPALGSAQIPNLDASKITTGTFAPALIPDLDASKITTGTLNVARIPDLDAAKTTTGTFALARIPALDASNVPTGTFAASQIPTLDASKVGTGTITNTVRNTTSVGTRSVEVYDSDSSNKVTIVTPATGSLTADYTLTLPVDDGTNGQVLTTNGSGALTWSSAAIGSVTSVDVNLPSIFTMAGGPITAAGTISATLASQAANSFWAAPNGAPGAPTFRAMVAADIPSLDAAKITTGTFTTVQIPALDASKVATGTFTAAQIPSLDASKVTTGTFASSLIPALGAAQLPNLDASKITTGTFATGLIPDLDAAKITSGTFAVGRIPTLDASNVPTGTFAAGQIPALDASKVATGTFAASQIPALDAAKITTGTLAIPVNTTGMVGSRSLQVFDSDSTNKVTIVAPATGSLTADYTLTLPVDDGTNGQVLTTNGSGALTWSSAAIGSVTSVDVNLPSIFTMAGGPITAAGTISATLASQAANSFWAAPNGAPGAPTFRAMVAADVPSLDAAKIATGTFTTAQIPALDASKVATGTFTASQIPALDASKVTTGTFAQSLIPALGAAQIPNLDASKITTGTFATGLIPDLDTAKITTGTLAVGRIPALDAANVPTGTFSASQIPTLDAAKIGTGTFTSAQIPNLDASKITTGTITNVVRNTTSVGTRSLEVYDSDSTNKVTIVTPATGSLTADYTLTLPVDDGTNGQVLTTNGSGALTWSSAAIGSVTSVDVNLPSIFTMAGGPITAAGTISATLASQAANSFWAAPNGAPGAPTFRAMVAADIPVLDAAKITTGTFTAAQIPALDAAKITTGTFATAQIPVLDAAKITTGTFASAQIPALDAAKITTGTLTSAQIPTLDAAKIGTGTFTAAQIPALDASKTTTGTFATALIPDFDASKITTGTISAARLPATANTWTVSGSNVYRASGNVGIGITNPTSPLQVVGQVAADYFWTGGISMDSNSISGGNNRLYFNANDDVELATDANLFLKSWVGYSDFATNGSSRMRISSSGNVGIGTTNPQYLLDVNGASKLNGRVNLANGSSIYGHGGYANTTVIESSNANTNTSLFLRPNGSGGIAEFLLLGNGFDGTSALAQIAYDANHFVIGNPYIAHPIDFNQLGTMQMRIATNGQIGIGTTVPQAKLDVNGGIRVGDMTTCTSASNAGTIRFNGGNLQICSAAGNTWTTLSTSSGDNLGNHTATANIQLGNYWLSGDGGNEGIFVKSDGAVGIGTTNPGMALDVSTGSGNGIRISNSGNLYFRNGANSGDVRGMGLTSTNDLWIGDTTNTTAIFQGGAVRMMFANNGYVGIGTTAPTATLEVKGNAGLKVESASGGGILLDPTRSTASLGGNGSGAAIVGPASTDLMIDLLNNQTNDRFGIRYSSAQNGTADTAGFVMTGAGLIGIGTTNPGTKLDVLGVITANVQGTAANQGGEMRYRELAANGANYAAIRAPDSIAADYVLTLPPDDGTSNQVLTTDGNGVLSWTTPSGGASSGTYLANNGSASAPTFAFTNDANNGMYLFGADSIALVTGGANRIVVDSGGKVGIGTTSPSVSLDIQDAGTNTGVYPLRVAANTGAGPGKYVSIAIDNQTSGAWKQGIEFRNNGTAKYSINVDANGNGTNEFSLYDNVAATTRFLVTSSGLVGIGTTAAPQAALDVNGGVRIGTQSTCNASTEGTQRYNSTSKKMEFCNGTAWGDVGGGGGGGGGLTSCPSGYSVVAASNAQGVNSFCINTTIQTNQNMSLSQRACANVGAHICRNRQLAAALASGALSSVTSDSWTGDFYPSGTYWNGSNNVVAVMGCTRTNSGTYACGADPTSGYASYCCID